MKILLIKSGETESRNNKDIFHLASFHPPLGLQYLGAVLEKNGHKVEIIDYCVEKFSLEKLKNALMRADFVGMSAYTPNINSTISDAKLIKEIAPEIPLVIGGPHCTFLKGNSLKDIPHADIAISGEGENVITDIVKYLQGRKKISDIPGVFYRKNEKINQGRPLEVIQDLDSICFPARHLVEKYDYGKINGSYLYRPRFTSMITSRGCPFRCRFCVRYSNFIEKWNFRQRSAENVVKEIIEIDEKYNSVVIVDDNFLMDKKRANKIFDKLIDYGTDIDILIEGTRVDIANRQLYKKMKKANVKRVAFGIESGCQDILDFYNKKTTLKQIRKAVKLAKDMGFITSGSFILGAPIETEKQIKKTINFACSLPLDSVQFEKLYYIMGSQLWKDAVKNKLISKDEYSVPTDSRRGLGSFTQEEIDYYVEMGLKKFYMRPTFLLSQLYRSFTRLDYHWIKNGIKYIFSF